MAKASRLAGIEEQHLLNGLEIELVPEVGQRDRWNQLVADRNYLHNATLVGEQLRYVVSYQKQWLAWLRWAAAAWHLKFCGWLSVPRHDLQSGRLDLVGSHGGLWACGRGFLCGA